MATYLVFAALVAGVKRWRLLWTSLVSLAALMAFASRAFTDFDSVLRCLAGFFAGCSIASFLNEDRPTVSRVVGWCAAFALLVFLQLKSDPRLDPLMVPLSGALIASLVATLLTTRGSVNSLLRRPVLEWLGARSYSLYMTHAVVIWVFSQYFRVAVKPPETMIAGLMVPQLGLAAATVVDGIILVLALGIAHLTYVWIEAPARRWSRAMLLTERAPATSKMAISTRTEP